MRYNYTPRQYINLSTDFSAIENGSFFINFSNGVYYNASYASNMTRFSSNGSSTNASVFIIRTAVPLTRTGTTPWTNTPGGGLNVTLTHQDTGNSSTTTYELNANAVNMYTFQYAGGTLVLRAGQLDGVKGSFELQVTGSVTANYTLEATASPPPVNQSLEAFVPAKAVVWNEDMRKEALLSLWSD